MNQIYPKPRVEIFCDISLYEFTIYLNFEKEDIMVMKELYCSFLFVSLSKKKEAEKKIGLEKDIALISL